MARAGHRVTILDRKYSETDPCLECIDDVKVYRLLTKRFDFNVLAKLCKRRGLRLVGFFLDRVNTLLFGLKASRYLSELNDFDVIHVHTTLVGVILAILNKKLLRKMVYTSHHPYWLLDSGRLDAPRKLTLLLDSYLIRKVRKVIALNDLCRSRFLTVCRVEAGKVVTASTGVDVAVFKPKADVKPVRELYGLKGMITVLFVGRIKALKGLDNLVEAANIIVNSNKYLNVLFLLVGPEAEEDFGRKNVDGSVSRRLRDLIKRYGLEKNVRLTGLIPFEELRDLYVASDIFVTPSLAEGSSAVVLEAMASGKPIVGTLVGGTRTQVKDGYNGFLVAPMSVTQLAEKIKFLVDNPGEREKMGENSRKLAEEMFNWENVSRKLLQVYTQMVMCRHTPSCCRVAINLTEMYSLW